MFSDGAARSFGIRKADREKNVYRIVTVSLPAVSDLAAKRDWIRAATGTRPVCFTVYDADVRYRFDVRARPMKIAKTDNNNKTPHKNVYDRI